MEAPFEYAGSTDTCIGCADILHAGDTVAPISEDRPDRLLCVSCWWLQACELPLPGWSRGTASRANFAGVFQDRPHTHTRRHLRHH
jgi:hypothetical protein